MPRRCRPGWRTRSGPARAGRRHLGDTLLAPGAPAPVRDAVDRIIAGGLARATGAPAARRQLDPAGLLATVDAEIARRREPPPAPARDLLDVIALAGDAPAGTPAEVYVRLVLSAVVNTGLSLAWAVRLIAAHPRADRDPVRVVRETMRLYPVAWMLSRRPERPVPLAGRVPPVEKDVQICLYLAHRDPDTWSDPEAYRPERWTGAVRPRGYMPFGRGTHACSGAVVVTSILTSVLALAPLDGLAVTSGDTDPVVTNTLAPPAFLIGESINGRR
jgi:cytochrome P450